MKLSEALKTLPAAESRNLLRQAVGERLDVPNDAGIRRSLLPAGSLLSQLKGVKTYAALRDRLPISVLLGLVCNTVTWRMVMDAIQEPATFCRIDGKTYITGWPAMYPMELANTVSKDARLGRYDEYAEYYSVFKTATTTTEKNVNLTDLSIDDIYETLLTLAATKFSLLMTQAQADTGGEIDAPAMAQMKVDAMDAAYALVSKHFGKEKADATYELLKVDAVNDITSYGGTDNEKAAFAVRKIVGEDSAAFRLNTDGAGSPLPEVVLNIKADKKPLLDLVLSQVTEGAFANTDDLINRVKAVSDGAAKREGEIARLKRLVASKPVIALKAPVVTSSHGTTLPSGTVISVKASDIFRSPTGMVSKHLNFDIPAFDWGGADHPYVPVLNKSYIFKPLLLARFLWALVAGKKGWLHGHTGTGKTEFVAQVCARLNWPMFRLNLDSEITRMDMIGRDVLSSDGKGATISKFVDGILPQAMTLQGHGAMLCVDEVSFGRPDVMYVFQRVLEDKGLLINEDGGRLVHPGDMFRIIATDNTRGQGDEFGAYAGARPQSAAFLDRFTCWIEFDYLAQKEEARLLTSVVKDLSTLDAEQIASFAHEVRTAFKKGQIYQTMSPRGSIALAECYLFQLPVFDGDRAQAIKIAAETTTMAKASENDKAVIVGLFDRTFK